MKRMKGLWLSEESVLKYQNAWLELSEDRVVGPDGKPGTFATVTMKPGVSVLAMDDLGHVYLTSEYRYAIERESIEVVSEGIDEGETAIVAARRELREELGIAAAEWIDLGTIDPFTSAAEPGGTELIRVLKVDLGEAVRMVLESEISHGPSSVLILKIHHLLKNERVVISE